MKLEPATRLDKRNKITSKKFDDHVMMLANDDFIVILPIYGQFGAIQKPDTERIVCKYIFINSNLLSLKTENRTKKSLTQLSQYCFK